MSSRQSASTTRRGASDELAARRGGPPPASAPGAADQADPHQPLEPDRPHWTGRRVAWTLVMLYGTNTRGGIDTAGAAAGLERSQRTIQRWLAEAKRQPPPVERAALLAAHGMPSGEALRGEQQGASYAEEAIARIALPRGVGILPAWRTRGWLEPHLVAVLEVPGVPGYGLRQLATARVGGRTVTDLRRRGELVDFTTVETRFHADLAIFRVLDAVRPWRIQPRAVHLAQGATRAFAGDAPPTRLDAVRAAISEATDR